MIIGPARITGHARAQMALRGVAESLVLGTVTAPDAIKPSHHPGRLVMQRTVTLGDPPFRALLRVVLDNSESPPAVVTVYVTTQFRRYGAEP